MTGNASTTEPVGRPQSRYLLHVLGVVASVQSACMSLDQEMSIPNITIHAVAS